jgi:hypothetical protein
MVFAAHALRALRYYVKGKITGPAFGSPFGAEPADGCPAERIAASAALREARKELFNSE